MYKMARNIASKLKSTGWKGSWIIVAPFFGETEENTCLLLEYSAQIRTQHIQNKRYTEMV